jgi:hypothetical protein
MKKFSLTLTKYCCQHAIISFVYFTTLYHLLKLCRVGWNMVWLLRIERNVVWREWSQNKKHWEWHLRFSRRWRRRRCSSGLWRRVSIFSPEDGESTFLLNVDICLWIITASQPRRTTPTNIGRSGPWQEFELVTFRMKTRLLAVLLTFPVSGLFCRPTTCKW